MEGIQVLDRPASRSFYTVAGRLLFIENFEPALVTTIDRLFAGWQLTPVSFPERNPDVKISFHCGERLPDIPRGLAEFEVAEGGRCYTAGEQYYLKFENSLLHLESGKLVCVRLWTTQIQTELAHIVSFAVCAALRRFGLFELHSAAVVVPGTEDSVLIVGPSGSGKSTLTLRLASAGWSYLSDDMLLLSLVGGVVEARGFRGFFALAQSAGSKTCFDPARVLASSLALRAVPRCLVFTRINHESESRWYKLAQRDTMEQLIRACPWATYDTAIAPANLELLWHLARQANGFALQAGADLLDAARASQIIRSFCSEEPYGA